MTKHIKQPTGTPQAQNKLVEQKLISMFDAVPTLEAVLALCGADTKAELEKVSGYSTAAKGTKVAVALIELMKARQKPGGAVDQMVEGIVAPQKTGDIIELVAMSPVGGLLQVIHVEIGSETYGRARLREFLKKHDGKFNLYKGINPRRRTRLNVNRRDADVDVVERRWVVLDLDFKDAPADDPQYGGLLARLGELSPAAQVNSGNGWHVYFAIAPVQNPAEAATDNKKVNNALQAVGSDHIGDLSRIIRVPGSVNIPTAKKRERGAVIKIASDFVPAPGARIWPLDELIEALLAQGGVAATQNAVEGVSDVLVSVTRERAKAPNLVLLRAVVEATPNQADDRSWYISKARAIKNACTGTAFERAGLDVFLEWADRWDGGPVDKDEDRRVYETLGPDTGKGGDFQDLVRDLRFIGPAEYERLKGEIAAGAFGPIPADELARVGLSNPGWLDDMNRKYGLVDLDGKLAAVDLASITSGKGARWYSISGTAGFTALMKNKGTVPVGTSKKRVGIMEAWMSHPNRNEFSQVGMANPGQEPVGMLNLFTGLALNPPKKGPWPKLDYHIREVVCAGDRKSTEFLLDLLAHKLQNPLSRPGICTVLKGGQGSGKSIFTKLLRAIFGIHAGSSSRSQDITGEFTSILEAKVFMDLAEACFAGDQKAQNALKALITDDEITIRRMHTNPYNMPNYLMLMMTTNEKWSVAKESDDRRYFILRVSDNKAGDSAYFNDLCRAIGFGARGSVDDHKIIGTDNEAHFFLHDMLTRDVAAFDPAAMPATKGGVEDLAQSLNGIGQWWLSILMDGDAYPLTFDAATSGAWVHSKITVDRGARMTAYNNWAKDQNKNGSRTHRKHENYSNHQQLGHAFKAAAGDVFSKKSVRDAQTGKVSNVEVFESLEGCRVVFERAHKLVGVIDWPAADP